MNKLFRFLDLCREGMSRQYGRLSGWGMSRSAEKRTRNSLSSSILRIEGLEERQLLAVTAGIEVLGNSVLACSGLNDQTSPVSLTAVGDGQFGIVGGFASEATPSPAAYARVEEKLGVISDYFNDPLYTQTRTKDYAVFFAGGVNILNHGYRYYANVVNFYCTLTTELNIAPENIYILYADGTDPAIDREDGQNSDMTFATDHGTSVYSATMANLTEVMDTISSSMDAESHLLFFGYDHGSGVTPFDDPEGYATNYEDYICGWGGNEDLLGADVAEQIFKVQEGYVTCVFSECFSGGMLDDIFTVSTGELNEAYTGNAHFYGMAAANHYEESWTRWDDSGAYYGFAQAFVSSLNPEEGGLLNTEECYAYTIANTPFVPQDEQYNKNEGIYSVDPDDPTVHTAFEHPWDMGESFDIFGFVPVYTAEYVVTTLDDVINPEDGELSLREAVLDANEHLKGSSDKALITFASDLAGGIIKLAEGQLEVSVSMEIDASSLGVKGITIDAKNNSRVFYITYGTEENPVTLVNLTITGGADSLGAGIYNSGILVVEDCVITQNVAQLDGGGIYNTGRLTMRETALYSNTAENSAGALYNSGYVKAEKASFMNNTVAASNTATYGGAVFNKYGTLSFSEVSLDANQAGNGAALASFYGFVTIGTDQFHGTVNTISGNHTDSSAAVYIEGGAFFLDAAEVAGNMSALDGGAIYAKDAGITIVNSSILRNAGANGGGIYQTGGALAIANTQITRNNASGEGGALRISGADNVRLVNVTIAGNSTGIWSASDLEIANSIVAANTGSDVTLSSGAKAAAYAVLSSFNGWTSAEGNLIYNESLPLFKEGDEGEYRYRLAEGSQAIDAGFNELAVYPDGQEIRFDIDVKTRRSARVVDLGAYEYQTETPHSLVVTTVADVMDPYDGYTSLREAIFYAKENAEELGTTITFDETLAGQTIQLDASLGALVISSSMTIDASLLAGGAEGVPGITIDAAAGPEAMFRVFEIEAEQYGIEVIFKSLSVTGGYWISDTDETNGAGIYARGANLTLIDSLVQKNHTEGRNVNGSGISVFSGNLTLLRSQVAENEGLGRNVSGAGVYLNSGTLTLKHAIVSENAVSGFYTYGGGIYVLGNYVVEDTLITKNISYASGSENDSFAYGGGLYAAFGSNGYIANTEISANTAGYTTLDPKGEYSREESYYACGGGLYIKSAELTIVNTTISANTAVAKYTGFGGGIFFDNTDGYFTLNNSIVLLNDTTIYGDDIYVQVIGPGWGGDVTYTLNGRRTISSFTEWTNDDKKYTNEDGKSLFVVNPEFHEGILANPELFDLSLPYDSLAVDQGINSFAVYADGSEITNDLAGGYRIFNYGSVDLGAYEYQDNYIEAASFNVTTLDDVIDPTDGETSLREALLWASASTTDVTITFEENLKGETIVLKLGELVIANSLTINGLDEKGNTGITIDAQGLNRIFKVADTAEDVTILGINMVNGSIRTGGDAFGGAVYAENTGELTLARGKISGCSVYGDTVGGGGVYTQSDLTLESFTVTSNQLNGNMTGKGGGIYSRKTVKLTDSEVSNNAIYAYMEMYGGGIYAEGGVSLDQGSDVSENLLRATSCSVSLSSSSSVLAAGVTLTAEVNPDGLSCSYRWYRGDNPSNMEAIDGAAGSSYTLTDDDAGCYIMVQVTAGGVSSSAITETVAFGVSLSLAAPGIGQTVTAAVVPSDAAFTYQWYHVDNDGNETLIVGADSSDYAITAADVNSVLKVVAVGTGNYAGYRASAETARVSDFSVALSNTKPQIGETLFTTVTPSDIDVAYQWYRVSGTEETIVAGANRSTYTVTASDAGYHLMVVITGTGDRSGYTAAAQTELAVFDVELSNTTPCLGETLSVNLLPDGAQARYIWYRGNDPNNMTATGQFGAEYTVTAADQGCYIQVVAIGLGAYFGFYASATTESLLAEYTITIDNTEPLVGQKIHAELDPADADVSLQWYREKDGKATAIAGAMNASYTVTTADTGTILRVVATGLSGYEGQKTYAQTEKVSAAAVQFSTNTPQYGEELAVSWNPEAMTANVQWYRIVGSQEVKIEGATDTAYTPTLDDIGCYLYVKVTGTGEYRGVASNARTRFAVESGDLEITLNPSIPAIGSEITASLNLDIDAAWQWYRVTDAGEIAIDGAVNPQYTVVSADIGSYLKVKAVGIGDYGYLSAEATTSEPVAVLSVSLSNDQPVVGETVKAELLPDENAGLYQWYRGLDTENMAPISGAAGSSYTVTSGDVGYYLQVFVFGTGSYTGSYAVATSTAAVTIAEPAPLPTVGAAPTGTVFTDAIAYGAGIYSMDSVTLSDSSSIKNNEINGVSKLYGVGVYSEEGTVSLEKNSQVSGNKGAALLEGVGGGIYAGNVTVNASDVSNNEIDITLNDSVVGEDFLPEMDLYLRGGGIYAGTSVSLSEAAVDNNKLRAVIGISNPDFAGYYSYAYGAGVYSGNKAEISRNSSVSENSISISGLGGYDGGFAYGAGVYARSLSLSGSDVLKNEIWTTKSDEFEGYGAGICFPKNMSGTFEMIDSNVNGNTITSGSGFGAGICVSSNANVTVGSTNERPSSGDNEVKDNKIDAQNDASGAGLYLKGPNGQALIKAITVDGNTIKSSTSELKGAGIYSDVELKLYSAKVTNNKFDGNTGEGGGLYCGKAATLVNTLISGNESKTSGGAYFKDAATIVNCTVVANSSGVTFKTESNVYNSIFIYNSSDDVENGDLVNAYYTISSFSGWANAPEEEGEGGGEGGGGEGGEPAALPRPSSADQDENGNMVPDVGDKLFLGYSNNPYSLAEDSIAADAGSLEFYRLFGGENAGNYDVIGVAHTGDDDDTISIGAYEFDISAAIISGASTIVVTTEEDGFVDDETSLREAIYYAGDGAHIYFKDSGMTIAIDPEKGGPFTIKKHLTIVGSDTTVSGSNVCGVFDLGGSSRGTIDVSMSNLTITEGRASEGAGIRAEEVNLTLNNVNITANNSSGSGRGVGLYAIDSTLNISNCVISNNSSGSSSQGTGFYSKDNYKVTMDNVTVSGNSSGSGSRGAGIYLENSYVTLSNGSVENNSISGGTSFGAGVYLTGAELRLGNVSVDGNSIRNSHDPVCGGGIYSSQSELTIIGGSVSGNTLEGGDVFGAGLCCVDKSVVKIGDKHDASRGVHIDNNAATADVNACGGGIYLKANSDSQTEDIDLEMNYGTIQGNSLKGYNTWGSGLYSQSSSYTIRDASIGENSATASNTAYGGAFFVQSSIVRLDKVFVGKGNGTEGNSIVSSTGAVGGGAIFADNVSDVYIYDSMFVGNTVAGSKTASGGGIRFVGGNLEIYNTQISENSATTTDLYSSTYGGGICITNGNLKLVNCTVAFNSARSYDGCQYSYGGGIFANLTGDSESTFHKNREWEPDWDIDHEINVGTLTVYNTIVAVNYALSGANIARPDLWETDPTIDVGDNNIIDYNPYFKVSAIFNRFGEIINQNDLSYYCELSPESRAINGGNNVYAVYEDGITAIYNDVRDVITNVDGDTHRCYRIYPKSYSNKDYNDESGNMYDYDGYGVVDIGCYEYQGIPLSAAHPSGHVTSLKDEINPYDDEWTLREAIYYAVEDTKIDFDSSLFGQSLNLNAEYGSMVIDKPLEIDFEGITLDSNNAFRALVVAEPAVISNVKIVNGNSNFGSGIYATKLIIKNSEISDCTASYFGGGVYSVGRLEMYNTNVTNCKTNESSTAEERDRGRGGAIHVKLGQTKYGRTATDDELFITVIDDERERPKGVETEYLSDEKQYRKYAKDNGVFIFKDGTISGCQASYGGAIYLTDATSVIQRAVVDSNSVKQEKFAYGAGIFITPYCGKTIVTDSYFTNNTANYVRGDVYSVGGAIYTEAHSVPWRIITPGDKVSDAFIEEIPSGLWLVNTVLSGNSALDGGAVYSYNKATVNLLNTTVAGNTSVYGGGIYSFGTLKLENSIVALNKATVAGNDIYRGPGSLNVYLQSDIFAYNTLSSYTEWNNFADSSSNYYRYLSNKPLFAVDPAFDQSGQLTNRDEMNLELACYSQAVNAGRFTAQTDSVLYPDVAANIFGDAGSPIPFALNGNEPDSAQVPRILGPRVDLGAYEYTDAPANTYGEYITTETIVVTTLEDVVDYTDSEISLREAIELAGEKYENLRVRTLITFEESLAESEDLTIYLDPELGALQIRKSLTIDASDLLSGEKRYLTINALGTADNLLRVFEISGYEETEESETVYLSVSFVGLKITGGYLTDEVSDEEGEPILPVGAGIYADYTNLTLTDCRVSGNVILSEKRIGGAGLYAQYGETFTLKNVVFERNSAQGEIVTGGGASVAHYDSIVVADSVFVRNVAEGSLDAYGAGFAVLGGIVEAANTAVVLNSTLGHFRSLGGGLYATGTVKLVNVTVGGNTAALAETNIGGGVYATGEFSAVNTIISGNDAAESLNLYAILPETSFSMIDGDAEELFRVPAQFDSAGLITNLEIADFDLAKEASAIDAGDTNAALYVDGTAITLDVAGNVRPQGDAVDIGAYEYSRKDLVVTTLTDGYDWSDGETSLREAIYLAGTASGSQYYETIITFDPSLRGGTINLDAAEGELVVSKDLVIDASSLYYSATGMPGITVSGAGQSRVFNVAGETGEDRINVELIGLGITAGYVNGGLNDAYGAGLLVSNTNLTMTDVVVSENRAVSRSRAFGAGLYLTDAALRVVRGRFDGNTVTGATGSFGGGLCLAADADTVSIRDSYLTGNTAAVTAGGKAGSGGALYTASASQLAVTNSQITGNTATDGAGIASFVQANISLVNDTIAGNTAAYGGGIFAFGSVDLYNTIVARNEASSDSASSEICRSGGTLDLYAASVYTADHTLSGYTAWDVSASAYADDGDDSLFAVSAEGDYLLGDGSPAIDCGDNSASLYEDGNIIQRDLAGNPRVEGDVVDLGAFESASYSVSLCVDTAEDVVDAEDGVTSLREAIAEATRQGTALRIYFADEIAGSTITLGSQLVITASMVIDGAGSGITISGGGMTRVFEIEGTSNEIVSVELKGLTIADGYAASDTESTYGAGIRAGFANIKLKDCVVTGNTVEHTPGLTYVYAYGAGLYASSGTVTISGSTFAGNTATDGGGAIYVSTAIEITDSTVRGNAVTGSYACGGGIYFSSGTMTMDAVTVTGNVAEHEDFTKGGGLYLGGGDVRISDSTITANSAAAGGGIYSFYNNSVTISGTTISGNRAGLSDEGNGFGGGIYSWGDPLVIHRTLVQGNSCYGVKAQGAGIYITYDSSVLMTNSAIVDNTASVSAGSSDKACGGGVYVYYSTMTISSATIAGNVADNGAGLYAYGLSASKPTSITFYNTIAAVNSAPSGEVSDIGLKNEKYVSFAGDSLMTGYKGLGDVENLISYNPAKPLFTDAATGDYSLSAGSQAVNVGNNGYVYYADDRVIENDLSGNPRVRDVVVDLGAYEYQSGSSAALATPENVAVTGYGMNRHQVSWSAVSGAESYLLQWSTDQSNWTEVVSDSANAVVPGLDYGTQIYYRVKAVRAGSADSDYSGTVDLNVCPMDINGDGDISAGDRALMAAAWLSEEGDDNWDPRCDINGDGVVSGPDRTLMSLNWLKGVGDDDLVYPPALADRIFAEEPFESMQEDGDFWNADLDIF